MKNIQKIMQDNPLEIHALNKSITSRNKSGRPLKGDTIKFGPQPKSHISKLLREIKESHKIKTIHTDSLPQDYVVLLSDEDSFFEDKNCSPKYTSSQTEIESKSIIGEKQYICDYANCNYACKLSSNLIKHKRTHSQEKPYLCDKCSFQSKFVNSLKTHKRIHTNERPYKCTFCDYCCNSSSNLKKHLKHRHSKELQN